MASPTDSWSIPDEYGSDYVEFASVVPAPVLLVILQIGMSIAAIAVSFTDPFSFRLLSWFVALLAAMAGVAYRYQFRKLSLRPEFRGLAAGSYATWLFRCAFPCTAAAIVIASYRASLVIPG